MKQKKQTYKQVILEWEDTTFYNEQIAIGELKNFKTNIVKTIGFLIKQDNKYLTIAMSCHTNKIMDFYIIPKRMIIKIRYL
jgi:hypothetical protein